MLRDLALPLSRKQIVSIAEVQHAPIGLWSGAVSSGKTIASLVAFLGAVDAAPDLGLIVVVGRTLQTIERNIIDPLQSTHLFGPFAKHARCPYRSTVVWIDSCPNRIWIAGRGMRAAISHETCVCRRSWILGRFGSPFFTAASTAGFHFLLVEIGVPPRPAHLCAKHVAVRL